MTIEEAKKIIEMCADAVKKGDGEDTKIYVNKDYVMKILDMVSEPVPITWPEPDYPYPWHPTNPWNPLDQGISWKDRFIYKKTTDGTGDDAPGKWVPTPDNPRPWEPWCNTTGTPPDAPPVIVTAEGQTGFASVDTSEPTHQFKETFTTSGPIKEA